MRVPQRALSQGRHAHAQHSRRGCARGHTLLRGRIHPEHIPEVEDRAGDRGTPVEDRPRRHTRLPASQRKHDVLA